MSPLYNIALVALAAGVASDTLLIAFVSGNSIAMFKLLGSKEQKLKARNIRWLFIFTLLFIIQNMVLIYGYWFGQFTKGMLKGEERLVAIGLLFSMGIRMIQELKVKNETSKQISLDTQRFLEVASGTAIYVFAFGCAICWLNMDRQLVSFLLLSLLILSLISGITLGKYHFEKTFKYLNTLSAFLVIAGSLCLIIGLLKN
jgi:putative Mn2+ efflux pump MntP